MYLSRDEFDQGVFYQGDIINDFPFVIFDKGTIEQSLGLRETDPKISVRIKMSMVMILSQTCDIQRRSNIIICPVHKMSDFSLNKDNTEQIKKRRIGYWFYLPGITGLIEDSIADFQTIYYVNREFLEKYKQNKIITLSDWGRHHLGWSLSTYFGRPIENR